MNRATNYYDVIVLGDEVAGAAAAALLARRGFRVLLLSTAPAETESVGLFAVPRMLLPLSTIDTPGLRRVLGELNLVPQVRRRMVPHQPPFQLLLPDHRLDGGEGWSRELERELPEQAVASAAFTARAHELSATLEKLLSQEVTIPPDGFWDRRDLKRIATQLPSDQDATLDELLRRSGLLGGLAAYLFTDLYQPGLIAQARAFDLLLRGTCHFEGGREALRALLHERARTYSAEIRYDALVRGLVVKRGRVVGVNVGARDEILGCGQVIAAMSAAELTGLLADRPPRRLVQAAALRTPLHRYHLHMVVPSAILPDALGPLALAVRLPEAPLVDGNALALFRTPAPGGHAILTAQALATDPSPDALAELRNNVLAHVDELFPFVSDWRVALGSPHDGLSDELGPEGTAIARDPRPMEPVWDFPAPRSLGLCGLAYASGIKELYFASRQNLPGLGLDGEFAAGWGVARLITLRSKRREIDKGSLLTAAG